MSILKLEIANDPIKRQYGLMFKKKLAHDAGMMFEFDEPEILRFWGENTYIPLDIAFIDNNNKIIDIKEIDVMSRDIVSSSKPCILAVEANKGFFKSNNIEEGFEIEIIDKDGEYCHIGFKN
jgi:uncharacterized membrane protein (UPF0127 family)